MRLLRHLAFWQKNESAVLCPACKNITNRYRIQNGFKLFLCDQCDLIFWEKYFENFEEPPKSSRRPDERPYEGDIGTLRWGQVLFLKRKIANSKLLLDFGCGNGNFLAACKNNNIQAIGCEASNDLLDFCKSHNHIVVPYTSDLATSSFDFITMWEVIEHIGNPSNVFDDLKRIIKPGGKLILSTPNFPHPAVSKTKLERYWPPFHVTFWNKHSLFSFLHNQGFEILNVYYRPFQHNVFDQRSLKKTVHEFYIMRMEILIIAQKK